MKKLIAGLLSVTMAFGAVVEMTDNLFCIQAKAYTFNDFYENLSDFFDFEGNIFCISGNAVVAKNPWDGTADTSWYNKNDDVFSISTSEQLAGVAQLSNSGESFEGKKINLTADVFMNGDEYKNQWTSIADTDSSTEFEGFFDGNGHTVYNLYGDGLFGQIGENGTVNAVNVSQGYIRSGAGAIADINYGKISFCNNKSLIMVSGNDYVGGICGQNQNLVYGCKNYGELNMLTGCYVGGIVGLNTKNETNAGTISECANLGYIAANDVSGISGINYSWIYNCYNLGFYTNSRLKFGIADNGADGHVNNCYYADLYYNYKSKPSVGDCAIDVSTGKYENCYKIIDSESEEASDKQIINKQELLSKIDYQTYSAFSSWENDSISINNGFPITVADYNGYNDKYKIKPEAWLTNTPVITGGLPSITDELINESTYFRAVCYYNDSEPKISIDNPAVAEVSCKKTNDITTLVTINYRSAGKANINFYFEETEICSDANYTIPLIITHTHSYSKTVSAATCTTDGVKTFTCECGDTYTETIPATGHTLVTDKAVAATCTTDGKTEGSYCLACGKTIKEQEIIPAKGHTAITDKAVAATCTTDGKTEGSHCSICNAVIKAQKTVKASGHTYNSGKITKTATCTEDGVKTYTCTVCGATKTETIPATGHTAVTDKAVAATCTTDGKTEGSHCSVCGEVIKAQETVKATGHKFGSWTTTKKATCKATGTQTRKCSVCGKTETKTVAKTAHTYKTTVVKPTYSAQGYTLHKCSVCGDSYKDKYTAKKTVGTVKAKTTYSSTTNAVCINWSKVSGATGYKVYRYNPTTKKWTSVKTISGASTLTYKDSGLKSGTSYKYKVRAYVKSGGKTYWGKYSSTVSTATKPATAKITKNSKSKTSVKLYWKKVNCTGYKVQRYNATTKKWVTVKTVSSATTNYKISGLKKNTSYKFRVCAYKNDGNKNISGAWSNITVKTAK